MSILTRIFVVLVMVLSVLLVALQIPQSVNVDTFKTQYLNERAARMMADANAANREKDLSSIIDAHNQNIAQFKQEVARLESQINVLTTQLQDRQAQVISLQNANADVRGRLARLSAALEQGAKINEMLQNEIVDRRTKMLDLQTKNTALIDSQRDLMVQVETLERRVRLDQELMADMEKQIEDLGQKVQQTAVSTPAPGAPDRPAGPIDSIIPIRGVVTDVQTINDEVFIAINVGRNDKVREGMRFLVHTGGTYLGDAVVTKVDQNSAAGRMTLQRGDVQVNNEVLAGPDQ